MNNYRSRTIRTISPAARQRPVRTSARAGLTAAFQRFQRAYPAYAATGALDALRATEYARLDRNGHVYLDYTGGGLYAESQLRDHIALLQDTVLGNPHSKNLTSNAATDLVERTRDHILRYFNAAPEEYTAVFTANATGALRLVGEAYPFAPGDTYLLTVDNHNSVNGIREFARTSGANVDYVPITTDELRVDPTVMIAALDRARSGGNNLLAYPAQSNFSGVQHPLTWIEEAHARGWDVLLDAAAFVPANRLDLRRWNPDFVSISFYKMFGYPTGVGCLLVRRQKLHNLQRPWYSGGTLTFSSVVANGHYLTPGPASFEDGTVNYLSIPAVAHGLNLIESVGIDTIHTRVNCLTAWLIAQLVTLRHSNGRQVVQVYGPVGCTQRGGTIAINFFDTGGRMLDCYRIEQLANNRRISLRAGCHCNPGTREVALGLTYADLAPCFTLENRQNFAQFVQAIENNLTGVLRASIGMVTTFADLYACLEFVRSFVDCEN